MLSTNCELQASDMNKVSIHKTNTPTQNSVGVTVHSPRILHALFTTMRREALSKPTTIIQ